MSAQVCFPLIQYNRSLAELNLFIWTTHCVLLVNKMHYAKCTGESLLQFAANNPAPKSPTKKKILLSLQIYIASRGWRLRHHKGRRPWGLPTVRDCARHHAGGWARRRPPPRRARLLNRRRATACVRLLLVVSTALLRQVSCSHWIKLFNSLFNSFNYALRKEKLPIHNTEMECGGHADVFSTWKKNWIAGK